MNAKRTLSVILASMMLSGAFLSCSEAVSEESAAENQISAAQTAELASEAEETEFTLLSTLPEYDFEGATVSFLSRIDSWWQMTSIRAEEITGEALNDAIYNRNLAFMDDYNSVMNVIDYDGSCSSLVRNTVSAGDSTYDVVLPNMSDGTKLINEDVVWNLHNIDSIDLSNPAWDQNASEFYTIAGRLYFGVSDISLAKNETSWIYMFNKSLIEEFNLENPYDLVREGKWTFDKSLEFMATASVDKNGNGIPDEGDIFGLATHETNFYALMISGGQPLALKNYEEDIPYLNGSSESFINVYDKLKDYFTNENETIMEGDGKVFMAGDALLCGQVMACVRLFREMNDDFGIIPTPKYDEVQEDYCTYVIPYEVHACTIPISAADAHRSGIAVQALSIYSKEHITPVYYDITITGKGLRDKDSGEMLDIILDSIVYDLARMYDWGRVAAGIPGYIEARRDFSSFYKKMEKLAIKELENTITAYTENTN